MKPKIGSLSRVSYKDGIKLFLCRSCGGNFPKSGYYRFKTTYFKISSHCKKCNIKKSQDALNRRIIKRPKHIARLNKARHRRRYLKHRDKILAHGRLVSKTQKGIARSKLNTLIACGQIIKPNTCQACHKKFKSNYIHGHHTDYSKPLDVMWLCPKCHDKEHKTRTHKGESRP